jgi:hypothetical protein
VNVESLAPRAQAPAAGGPVFNFAPNVTLQVDGGTDPERFRTIIREEFDVMVRDFEAERRAALND